MTLRITNKDYIKAVKKADREIGLENGFKSTHKIFRSKKLYNRKKKHKNNDND